ncbi:ExbD/TolR family protein [Hydrogenothermus marinus]|uniref:Outer membrane transport energization protein ExbD n=1 Tax=Hydrogenothermus marinus TaxID=133270 RepID=A0A3M0BIR5_9AQUI|nr:biopolymer transporter ExbD [Hydrogenothermus marinus]RMA97280.1 outer membrane transport energization protein ExbD [Hydrogenothermus marinus]
MDFKKYKNSDNQLVALDLTALVDIAFIIILFLGIVSSLAPLSSINVELPQASTSETVAKPVKIVIDKDGNYYIEGKKVDEKQIADYLKSQKKKTLIIIADRRVIYDKVVRIMDIAKQNGIEEINIATRQVAQ